MRRRLALLTLFLLGMSAAAAAGLWWRSWRHAPADEDRYSWIDGSGRRLTVRSDAGRLTLFAPPVVDLATLPQFRLRGSVDLEIVERTTRGPSLVAWNAAREPARAGVDPPLGELIAALRNDHFEISALAWPLLRDPPERNPSSIHVAWLGYDFRPRTAPEWLKKRYYYVRSENAKRYCRDFETFSDPAPFADSDIQAALLPALEDPQRFAIAHLLLSSAPESPVPFQRQPDGLLHASVDGLALQVSPPTQNDVDIEEIANVPLPKVSFAVEQLPAIRDRWHRQFDREVMSAPYWVLTLAAALLALFIWRSAVVRALLGVSRRRRGLCINCGFDLRATPGDVRSVE